MYRLEAERPYIPMFEKEIEEDEALKAVVAVLRTTDVFRILDLEDVVFLNRVPDIGIQAGYFYDKKERQLIEFEDGDAITPLHDERFDIRLKTLREKRQKT